MPYAALGKGLRSAGHQVCFVTAENFEPMVTARGLDFLPVRGDAQALVQDAGADMLALVRSFSDLSKALTRDLDQLAPVLQETDVILNQLPGGLYGYDLAEKFDTPMILAAVIPLTRTTAFPMMGWPSRFAAVPGYNGLSYRLAEQAVWQMFRSLINRWRQQTLGLPKLPFGGYFRDLNERRVPVLNGFSAYVVPRPDDWDDHIHVTGYWFPQDEGWQPPDDLRRFIEAGPPPVFVGFGSMPISHQERTASMILSALERSGQRAVLHAGWARLGKGALPGHVFGIDYAPYDWLFPRMSAIVHHGGSGTTGFGLRAGVPALIVPFLFDQFFWGRRVAALGVGPEPIPFRRLSAERLAEAIEIAASDPHMRQRASALGQKIRAENGIAKATKLIEKTCNQ